MNVLKAPIDYVGLEQELHDALRLEELYNLQNDAKFRAIEQAVPTYEDFREMVNAAHLKCLDRKDITAKVGVEWNSVYYKTSSQSSSLKQRSKTLLDRPMVKPIPSKRMPTNVDEFRQTWNGLVDYTDKFQLLIRTRLTLRDEIFRSEIPPELLNEFLYVCLESLKSPENSSSIVGEILITLSECNRFKLAVAFMSEKDKSLCRELFRQLRVITGEATNDLEKNGAIMRAVAAKSRDVYFQDGRAHLITLFFSAYAKFLSNALKYRESSRM